jgi:hypothetical protein
VLNVIALDRAEKSMLPMTEPDTTATVADVFSPVLPNTTVSCGKGKLASAGDPPLDDAQALSHHEPPPARLQ